MKKLDVVIAVLPYADGSLRSLWSCLQKLGTMIDGPDTDARVVLALRC